MEFILIIGFCVAALALAMDMRRNEKEARAAADEEERAEFARLLS